MISYKWENLIRLNANMGIAFKHVSLALLIIITFNSCSLVKPIEFKKVNSFQINEESGKVKIVSNLTLYNPNGFNFAISNADIDVYAEGINLGKLQIPDKVSINKKDEFTGDFKVEISLVKLLLAGKNILPKLKQGTIAVEMKGFIQADVLWMNKKFNINYKEKVSLSN